MLSLSLPTRVWKPYLVWCSCNTMSYSRLVARQQIKMSFFLLKCAPTIHFFTYWYWQSFNDECANCSHGVTAPFHIQYLFVVAPSLVGTTSNKSRLATIKFILHIFEYCLVRENELILCGWVILVTVQRRCLIVCHTK